MGFFLQKGPSDTGWRNCLRLNGLLQNFPTLRENHPYWTVSIDVFAPNPALQSPPPKP